MLEQFDLSGKVAIVTGCSAGLGQGMALGLAEAGADIVDVDYVDFSETQTRIEGMGRKFLGMNADLSTPKPIEGIIQKTVENLGKLDILVNNAGIIRRSDAIEFTEKEWDDVMDINIKTVFFFGQAAARQFIKQGTRVKIINIASMNSFQGGFRVASYTASKTGVMGITRHMANEWAKHNINANAIAPDWMATNLTAALRADPERNKDIPGRIPAGRWGTPDDLKGSVKRSLA